MTNGNCRNYRRPIDPPPGGFDRRDGPSGADPRVCSGAFFPLCEARPLPVPPCSNRSSFPIGRGCDRKKITSVQRSSNDGFPGSARSQYHPLPRTLRPEARQAQKATGKTLSQGWATSPARVFRQFGGLTSFLNDGKAKDATGTMFRGSFARNPPEHYSRTFVRLRIIIQIRHFGRKKAGFCKSLLEPSGGGYSLPVCRPFTLRKLRVNKIIHSTD